MIEFLGYFLMSIVMVFGGAILLFRVVESIIPYCRHSGLQGQIDDLRKELEELKKGISR